jgi:hypothetical protein
MHRERNRHRPYTEDRAVRNRARHRAVAALVELHRDEFERLYANEMDVAVAEAARIREHVAPTPVATSSAKPREVLATRLRPGPRPAGLPFTDRIRDDVGACPRCAVHHDTGHRCPVCGAEPQMGEQEARRRVATLRQMRCTHCQADGTQRLAPCRATGRVWSRHDFRLERTG